MRTLRATTLAGTDIQLDSAAVTAFKARLHGALLCPEDPPYEQARKVWNGMIDKHPALIARCTGVADVLTPSASPGRMRSPSPCAVAAITRPVMPPVTAGSSRISRL